MRQQMNVEQAFRIKKLLAERRLSITSLAMKLGEAYGSVANTIYGHRRNPELRGKIAAFLGRTPEELFGENGEDHRLETCATGDAYATGKAGATEKEVSHG